LNNRVDFTKSVIFENSFVRNSNQTKIDMNILRQVNNIQLNEGSLMAKGLYNLAFILNNVVAVSVWFDEEEKDRLLTLSDEEFESQAKEIIAQSNID
jgi:hypothetical protein